MAEETVIMDERQQRRQMRRKALWLGLLALSFYAAYIAFALIHGHR